MGLHRRVATGRNDGPFFRKSRQMTERRTGQTTRQALAYVQECLDKAGTPVRITDHSGVRREHRRLANIIDQIIYALNVDYRHSTDRDGFPCVKVLPL